MPPCCFRGCWIDSLAGGESTANCIGRIGYPWGTSRMYCLRWETITLVCWIGSPMAELGIFEPPRLRFVGLPVWLQFSYKLNAKAFICNLQLYCSMWFSIQVRNTIMKIWQVWDEYPRVWNAVPARGHAGLECGRTLSLLEECSQHNCLIQSSTMESTWCRRKEEQVNPRNMPINW